ncbi:hypothetical protein VM1G_11318 [Cytospora mali]|uniref:Uncharacterized protein n=1 Tax=Cytospora mali TaxID=578113 RepID=A0A194VNV3_CYTMA|nr:hypothetical protein VM1G_11318 [Valsa mali]
MASRKLPGSRQSSAKDKENLKHQLPPVHPQNASQEDCRIRRRAKKREMAAAA